ncbi:MAG: septation protein A [Gammaproteobacteria bacterium]|nr:septation protein A [Gammaproteobacteria bacterium]
MKFLFDFFPIILFFAAYKAYGIYIATGVAIAASFIQVGLFWHKHRRFENMQLISLGLIAVFGGVTLLLHDEIFIKWKPTVLNWLLAAAFLGSQFIGGKNFVQRMMGAAIVLPVVIWRRLNLAWVIFFAMLGAANLYVVYHFDTDTWVDFKLFGMLGLTFAFVIAQSLYIARYAKPGNGES